MQYELGVHSNNSGLCSDHRLCRFEADIGTQETPLIRDRPPLVRLGVRLFRAWRFAHRAGQVPDVNFRLALRLVVFMLYIFGGTVYVLSLKFVFRC